MVAMSGTRIKLIRNYDRGPTTAMHGGNVRNQDIIHIKNYGRGPTTAK
jgi:hypothetical protein